MLDIFSTTTYNCIIASIQLKSNKKTHPIMSEHFIFCIFLFFLLFFHIIICRDGRELIKN